MSQSGQGFCLAAASASQGFSQVPGLTPMEPTSTAALVNDIAAQRQAPLAGPSISDQYKHNYQLQQQQLVTSNPSAALPTPPAATGVKQEPHGAPALALGLGPAPGPGQAPSSLPTATGVGTSHGESIDPEAIAAVLAARITAAGASIIFEKALTASDVSGGGRVVVPKSVAEQYFPHLDQPSGVTISAMDLDGRSYTFKWRFWVNNSSRMYLLEGAAELHRNYGLEVGDLMVFAQKPDGSLVVAGRVASKSDFVKKAPTKRPAAAGGGGGSGGGGHQASRGRDARGSRSVNPRIQQQSAAAAAMAAAAVEGAAAATAPPGAVAPGQNPAAAAAADSNAAVRVRKRKGFVRAPSPTDPRFRMRSDEGSSLAVLEMEAPSDGIFRAVVTQHVASVPLGVALARNNRWTATLDVAGEIYQAFFDTREDAVEALTAAGASP